MSQDIESTITQLEAWRDRINASIETLKYFLAQGPTLPSSPLPGVSRSSTDAEIRHDSFFQMTILDAAEKYLAIVKVTKSTAEMSESLLNGGLKTAAKNFPETLRSAMGRDERFVRVNGEWGLAAWYPAMKRERKPRQQDSESRRPKQDSRPANTSGQKPEKAQPSNSSTTPHQDGFSPESLKGRALQLLTANPKEIFTAQKAAEALNEAHVPSVTAALSTLLSLGLIDRPNKGHYTAKSEP